MTIDKKIFRKILKRIRKYTLFFLEVRVDNIDAETALEAVHTFTLLHRDVAPCRIFFTNVHTIYLARKNPEFRHCINAAEMVLADGSGLKIAGRAFGTPIRANLNGTDFAPKLFRYAEQKNCSVYLLGGREEIVNVCKQRLQERYPNLTIVGCKSGYFTDKDEKTIIEDINARQPDILLVAFGSPNQELWIARHRNELSAQMCFAVGGLFDFIAGAFTRAPKWMRAVGIEWLFRFCQNPKSKWKRVFVEIPSFLTLVLIKRVLPGYPHVVISKGA